MTATGKDAPVLLTISRCRRDGHLSYPADERGCQVCGAYGEDMEIQEIPARGTVMNLVTVRRHRGWPAAPFQIAAVKLDGGPVVRTLLLSGAHGDLVRACRLVDDGGHMRIAFGRAESR